MEISKSSPSLGKYGLEKTLCLGNFHPAVSDAKLRQSYICLIQNIDLKAGRIYIYRFS